jgi:hypothetical protein
MNVSGTKNGAILEMRAQFEEKGALGRTPILRAAALKVLGPHLA